ncbi:metallophosphoesterase [Acidobacteriota bacterium]
MKNITKKISFLILVAAFSMCLSKYATCHTQAATEGITITGYVFFDKNDNALHDQGEPGIAGVVVSDQIDTVVTDQNGVYRIDSSGGLGVVFISIPNEYSSRVPFWKHIERKSDPFQADFPLKKGQKINSFSFIHASDPHLSKALMPRFKKFKSIVRAREPAFVLMTGDLLHDALRASEEEARGYFELYKGEVEKFPAPLWNVPGNHEIFGIERGHSLVSAMHPLYGKKMYRLYLGPDYYSFNYGGVHFIGLNTVQYHNIWYYGYIDNIQLAWLERDLSFVTPGTPVVIFNHIPFYSAFQSILGLVDSMRAPMLIKIDGKTYFRHMVNNVGSALNLLKRHNFALALAGHLHSQESLSYELEGMKVRFNQSSAIQGDISFKGMHMVSGVTLYRVVNGEIDDGEFIPLDKAQNDK